MWTAAILAGGQSRRLGGINKATLRLEGRRLIERQLALVRSVVGSAVIVANDPAPYLDLDVNVIPDVMPDAGPLGGIYSALRSADADRVLVVACDMPFLGKGLLRFLVDTGAAVDLNVPKTSLGYEPLCATYSRGCAAHLLRLIQERRLKLSDLADVPGLSVQELGPDQLEPFGPADLLFFNINTLADYDRAVAISRERQGSEVLDGSDPDRDSQRDRDPADQRSRR